jgi:response regulator of citrate/malate metabolism
MSALEVAKGNALTEYRQAQKELKKHPNAELAKQLLDAMHQDVLAMIERQHNPNHIPPTTLDLSQIPEEAELTDDDKAELEKLPEATRTRLKELLKIAAA